MGINRQPNADLPFYLLHWNKPAWCARSITSLRGTVGIGLSLTVIDNGSDPPLDLEGVRIVRLSPNVGYTGAANAALGEWASTGEPFCVIGTHDLHVAPDTLARMLEVGHRYPDAGIIAPDYPRCDAGRGGVLSSDGTVEEREWTSGMCLMVRGDCVRDIGGFDQRFFAYVEDVEYCERARAAGWKVYTTLGAAAHGLGTGEPKSRRLILANEVLITSKRYGRLAAAKLLALHLRAALAYSKRAACHQEPPDSAQRASNHWFALRRGARQLTRKEQIPRFEFGIAPRRG